MTTGARLLACSLAAVSSKTILLLLFLGNKTKTKTVTWCWRDFIIFINGALPSAGDAAGIGFTVGSVGFVGFCCSRYEEAQTRATELQLQIDGLEKERDFYFGKLRDIEILCQQPEVETIPVVEEITKVLYATEEGFEAPPDAGEQLAGGDEY